MNFFNPPSRTEQREPQVFYLYLTQQMLGAVRFANRNLRKSNRGC